MPTSSYETIHGTRLHVMQAGAGPTMVYFHGGGGAPAWLPFMEELSKHFRLIVPEHPGFGRSDSPAWLDDVSDLAYFYLDAFAAWGLEDVHLVGTSIGGWLACELAIRDTRRLRSLSLVAPAGLLSDAAPLGDILGWSPEEAARNFFASRAMAEGYLANLGRMTPEQRALAAKTRETFTKLARTGLHSTQLRKWLHRVDIPSQVIWGKDDRVVPVHYAGEFAKALPHAEVRLLDECGHLPMVEKMAETATAIEEFVRVNAFA